MKANIKPPRVWRGLTDDKKKELQDFMSDLVYEQVIDSQANLQITWMKLCCILLHNAFGFGEKRLLTFIANWKRIYHVNGKIQTAEEQKEWLDAEMKKCFPKTGFPADFVESLKEVK